MRDFADRRTVLRSGVAACTAGLAGCLEGLTGSGDDDSPPAENGSDGDDDSGTDDSEPEPEPEPLQSWPSFQNGARNSGYAEGRAPSEDLEVAWTFEGREDVGTNEDDVIRGGPVISEDGIVYVGTHDKALYALDIEDGSLRWGRDVPQRVEKPPAVYDDLVIIGMTGVVQARDRFSGDLKWEFPIRAGRTPTTPVVANDTLAVGTGDGVVYSVDVTNGSELWSTEREQDLAMPAAIADGSVYVCDWTNDIHVFDLSTGTPRYSTSIDGTQLTGATVVDGTLYVGDDDGTLYAKDVTNSGETIWTYSNGEETIPESPAVADDLVYVWDDDVGISAVERGTGTEAWSFEDRAAAYSAPAVVDDVVYVGSSKGTVYAIDRRSGELLDAIEVGLLVYTPAVAHDTIVVGSQEGTVYGIRS